MDVILADENIRLALQNKESAKLLYNSGTLSTRKAQTLSLNSVTYPYNRRFRPSLDWVRLYTGSHSGLLNSRFTYANTALHLLTGEGCD
jgi:hypothetical protein